MNLFDINGTNKNSFTIGLEENKIELSVKDGKLYLRNFNSSSFIDLSTKDPGILEITQWEENKELFINNIISYNGSLFLVKVNHISGLIFEEDKFSFILSFDSLNKISANNSNIFNILKSQGNDFYFYGTNTGIQTIILPDALKEGEGKKINIYNFSNCILDIFLFDTTTFVCSIPNNQIKSFVLHDNNSSNGLWNEIASWKLNDASEIQISQINTFIIGDIIGHDGNSFIKVKTTSVYSPIGIIKTCNNNGFTLAFNGYLNLINYNGNSPFPLLTGKEYYLSELNDGEWITNPLIASQSIFTAISDHEITINFKDKKTKVDEIITINNNDTYSKSYNDGLYIIYNINNPEEKISVTFKNLSYLNMIKSFSSRFSNIQGLSNTINIYNIPGGFNIENKTGNIITIHIVPLVQ